METTFIFNRKNELDSEKKGLIELQVYITRTKRPTKSTGIRIEPKYWDKGKQFVSRKHPNFDFINKQLTAFRSGIENYLIEQTVAGQKPDITNFGKARKSVYFFDFFENVVMKISNIELTDGTKRLYKRTVKYLREFSEDLPINEVNVSFCERFNKFLIETKNLHINSRSNIFKKIKKAYKLAVQHDIVKLSESPFEKGFSLTEIEPEKKSLTLNELQILEGLNMDERPELVKTRDMFLFACYTGLRFSDLVSLSFENFEVLENDKIRLLYRPQKTIKSSTPKLIRWIVSDFWNGKVDFIIKKYLVLFEMHRPAPVEARLFFKYENQVYNRNLKELQRHAKIKTVLTSHLARHTCITLLVNDFHLDITKAQLIAGHSKIEMTMKYLRIMESDLSAAGNKIDWK